MAKSPVPKSEQKADWVITQRAFRKFLDWLDAGNDSGGERYLEIRRRLVFYFDRKNCLFPDELADETLNRVARRLEEEGAITTDAPSHYCYIVARFVFLEFLRAQQHQELIDENLSAKPDLTQEKAESERRTNCLERCVQNLDRSDQTLIVNYYQGQQRTKIENRKTLAAKLGITMNALSIRVCRIRDKLEACVRKCMSGEP